MAKRSEKVVVVGAGLGGISAAISLATEGFPVALYEKNPRIGGKLNIAESGGYRFDLGPSIIILPHLFRRLFERAGRRMEDYVEFERLEPQWRSFWEDGTVLDLWSDTARMAAELAKLPDGGAGYFEFLEYSRRLWQFTEETYLERGADQPWEIWAGKNLFKVLKEIDAFASVDDGVGRYVREPHLRNMLDFFVKYVGSSSFDAPAMLNLLPWSQLAWGLFYVRGGMYQLARAYERLLRELGVEIHCDAEVTQITHSAERRVDGVRLADGTHVPADIVVSNMEVVPAHQRLLGDDGLLVKTYEKVFEPAASGIVVHLGLDTTYPQLQHHNFFFAQDQRHHFDQIHRRKVLPDDPTIYLVCPTRTDPSLAPPGRDLIKILPHIPYKQDPPFGPADYEALKQRVYDKLERMGLTDLRKHIVVEDMLTPDDIERMYYSTRGAIYGVVSHRLKNFALKAPKRSVRYKGLYFVGGSVNPGGGTCMVVLCGQNVRDLVLRDLVLRDLG
jgi:diapolycopene oxygenase